MKTSFPKTYLYFKKFEKELWQRKSSGIKTLMDKSGFYAMFGVGPYTMAPYKVVWKALSSGMMSVVINKWEDDKLGKKLLIPEHNNMFIPCYDESEAHFLCAILNSYISDLAIKSYCDTFKSAFILENLNIPRYNSSDLIHQKLANLSKEAHLITTTTTNNNEGIKVVEKEIDKYVALLWCINEEELHDIYIYIVL